MTGHLREGWRGRYYEDFTVGDVYRSRLGRTITEYDNIAFTLLTNNTNPIHFDSNYSAATEFGRCLVNSLLTISVVTGLGSADISDNGIALGWEEIALVAPVFAGDTLYSESQVLEKRPSRSRPGQGIIKVETRGLRHDGTLVVRMRRSVMVWRREAAPSQRSFPGSTEGSPGR